MKTSARRALPSVLALLATAVSLRAHPGHDGDHGLTWELSHLAEHPWATLGWGVVALGVLGGAVWLRRRRLAPRAQSLRTSQLSRGK